MIIYYLQGMDAYGYILFALYLPKNPTNDMAIDMVPIKSYICMCVCVCVCVCV